MLSLNKTGPLCRDQSDAAINCWLVILKEPSISYFSTVNVTSAWNLYEIGQFCPHLIDLLTADHSQYLSTGTG